MFFLGSFVFFRYHHTVPSHLGVVGGEPAVDGIGDVFLMLFVGEVLLFYGVGEEAHLDEDAGHGDGPEHPVGSLFHAPVEEMRGADEVLLHLVGQQDGIVEIRRGIE